MTNITADALHAAADAIHERTCPHATRCNGPSNKERALATAALEAAAPHIAAAERERIRQLALTRQAAHVLGSSASRALEAFADLLTEGEPDGS